MTFRHVAVSLCMLSGLSACSDDDTIVSLNVNATDDVPAIERLSVTITQGPQSFVSRFTPPLDTASGDDAAPPSLKNSFFQRIILAKDWEEERALIQVVAEHADGTPLDPPIGDETTVTIQPEGVVAAYVELDSGALAGGSGASGVAGAAGAFGVGGASGDAGASASGSAGQLNSGGTAGLYRY